MLQAEKELVKAQTQKTTAEANKIKGVDTEEAQARIKDLTQGIKNKEAVERLTRVQTQIEEINLLIQEGSHEDVISTIRYTSRIAKKQLGLLKNEKKISDETWKLKIGLVEGELIGLGIANELGIMKTELTQQQTEQVIQNVAQGWSRSSNKGRIRRRRQSTRY